MKRNQIIHRMVLVALLGIVSEAVAMQEGSSSSSEIPENRVKGMLKSFYKIIFKDPTSRPQEEKNLLETFKTETPEIQSWMLWCFKGQPSLFKQLFNAIKNEKSIFPIDGYTLLHLAVLANDYDTIDRLLKEGAAPNAETDDWGYTPLHLAVKEGKGAGTVVLDLLKTNGANIDATGKYADSVLHEAVERENLKAVRWLLEHKVKLNRSDSSGKTELHKAVENPSIVKELLKAGCDPIPADNDGKTPLDAAQSDLDWLRSFEEKQSPEIKQNLLESIKLLKSPSSSSSSIN